MKTAISLPDPLFEATNAFAQRLGIPRSQVIAQALREYLEHQQQQSLTESLNAVYAEADSKLAEQDLRLQQTSLAREDW